VKLRDLPRALGARSPVREYPFEVAAFNLPKDGVVQLARWQHPSETPKSITQESVDLLRTFLRAGDVAIDIGAHTGDSTVPIALAVGVRGRVFALEPNPYVFKVLQQNATLNVDRTRITPLMFAAMAHDGQYEFEYSDAGYCNGGFHDGVSRWRHGHFHRLRVEGRNLERYLSTHAADDVARIRYIKIDTEGFDRAVVQTLRPLVAEIRPYIRTEIYKHVTAAERNAYDSELRLLGYRLFKCEEDDYRGRELALGEFERWRHFDVFAVPRERS
jgi:FkbM family methyltransferase